MPAREKTRVQIFLLLFISSLFSMQANANEEKSIDTLVKEVKSGVVTVFAYDNEFSAKPISHGLGFFVYENKLITNWHVVRNAKKLAFRDSAGKIHSLVGISGVDVVNDLVVSVAKKDFKSPAVLELSKELPGVGTNAYVLGSPLGTAYAHSEGLVSSYREIDGRKVVQISAAISSDFRGSPVFLRDGSVIGMATFSMEGGQSLNLAIPITMVSGMIGQASKPIESLFDVENELLPRKLPVELEEKIYAVFAEMYLKECKTQGTNRPRIQIGSFGGTVGHLDSKVKISRILSEDSALVGRINKYGTQSGFFKLNGIDLSDFRDGKTTYCSKDLVFAQVMTYQYETGLGRKRPVQSVETLDKSKLKRAVFEAAGPRIKEVKSLTEELTQLRFENAKLRVDITNASKPNPALDEARDLERKIALYESAAKDRPQIQSKVRAMKKRLKELNVDEDSLTNKHESLASMEKQLNANQERIAEIEIKLRVLGNKLPAVLW